MEIFKKLKPYLLPVTILIGLTVYVFRQVPVMLIEGEGFLWLVKSAQVPFWKDIPISLANFEVSAVLVGTLLTKLFGANLYLYNWTWLLVMIFIDISLFFLVLAVTKNKLLSFASALIFSVNYMAQWGYIGWTYTSFLERTITVIFLIPGFTFLHLYLEKKRQKYFVISILLYFIAIEMGQWGLIFGGAYILYPIFWHLFNLGDKKLFLKRVLTSVSFLIVSLFFLGLHYINQAGIGPRYGLSYFLLRPQTYHYLEGSALQLTHWTNYANLLDGVSLKHSGGHVLKIVYKGSVLSNFSNLKKNKVASPLIVALYLIAAFVIYLRLHKQRAILFTIFAATFAILVINVYFFRYSPFDQPGPNRYLYLPSIWLSVFWGLFLWSVFLKNKMIYKVFGCLILTVYFLINSSLISENFRVRLYGNNSTYLGNKRVYEYILNIAPDLKPNTLVVTPWDEMSSSENQFLEDQLGKGNIKFMLDDNTWAHEGGWELVASSSAHVIKLDYDKGCGCVKEEIIK